MNALRVLIVDNVPEVRQDLSLLLGLVDGLEVVGTAKDGLDAIHLTHSLIPDVILMDLEMPVVSGYEATRQIKALHPTCRIIALTVHDYEQARCKASQAGMDAFIVKGDSMSKILQTIFCSERINHELQTANSTL